MEINHLDKMFAFQRSPSVLRMKLIKVKRVSKLVFVFEGDDDFSFYEQLIKNAGFGKTFEHIVADGKEQVVSLLNEMLDDDDQVNLNGSYFFVDQDYDPLCYIHENIFNLDSYSIESYLLNNISIDSLLRDELKISGDLAEHRSFFFSSLENSYARFSEILREYCKYLLICQHKLWDQTFVKLSDYYLNVSHSHTQSVREFNKDFYEDFSRFEEEEQIYVSSIDLLSDAELIRGKYILWFIKKWLISVKDEINKMKLIEPDVRLAEDVISIRRLSQNCPKIDRLNKFLSQI